MESFNFSGKTIVPEEELGYLYLNLDTFGGSYEFSESSLALGYVDIRQ